MKKYGTLVALSLVVSTMIGTGIFTSLGFQVLQIKSAFAIILLWAIGGLVSLCGAFTYAEISILFPKSGGEYNYLGEIYHPSLGFASGIISIIVGFSAPCAAMSMASAKYFSGFYPGINPMLFSCFLILLICSIQILGLKMGERFQNFAAFLNVFIIISFCLITLFLKNPKFESGVTFAPQMTDLKIIFSPYFFASLVWVFYAYSGWNASTYIAGHLKNPKKALNISLFGGIFLVMALYILINYVFLKFASFEQLAGKIDVVNIITSNLFGIGTFRLVSFLLGLVLIAPIGACFLSGSRLIETMGEDYLLIRPLSLENKSGAPYMSIILQGIISLGFIFTLSFEWIINYIGVTLALFSTLTVAGIFIIRKRIKIEKIPIKTIGYPLTPIIFIFFHLAMICFLSIKNPAILFSSLFTILISWWPYYFMRKKNEIG